MAEACRVAMACNCVVFNVETRFAPEYKCPIPQMDFYDALRHICDNSKKFRVDSDKLCTMGMSGGAWIVLGAAKIHASNMV